MFWANLFWLVFAEPIKIREDGTILVSETTNLFFWEKMDIKYVMLAISAEERAEVD